MYKMNKLQGYIVQYRKHSEYFKMTLNEVQSMQILYH